MQVLQAERTDYVFVGSNKTYTMLFTFSLMAHLFAFWLLAMSNLPRGFRARPVKSIGVELIGTTQFEKLFAPPVVEEPPTASLSPAPIVKDKPQELPPPVVREEPVKGLQPVIADNFQLGRLLEAPENKELKESLVLFDPSDQREQLCNLEVMEQIHLWNESFNPERVVAFAYKDPVVFGDTVTAEGAAFRSKGEWYHLAYRCTWNPTTNLVTALEFLSGDLIPHSEWEDHFLFAQ
ncbi:protein of unknown function [Pseudovibrio denitrificans]|uniref:DUF930 domain-containing protein n=1 Tax=Pseudovibrio denitrificans TaxID=258256 RepID=A0A1I7D610_9HYPH|nr:DUF930 domain-containing protein [Pseudovibrio denitrificans]SFU07091.1 protein of unknown function [Pseudovibrio denitrificans]